MKFRLVFTEKEAFRTSFQEWASGLIRKSGELLYRSVFDRTPVDSGNAKSNWNCSINTPDFSYRESANLNSGKASGAFAGAIAGDTLYITNTTPYILELEKGHSQQAPRGMTDSALRECAAQIESGE